MPQTIEQRLKLIISEQLGVQIDAIAPGSDLRYAPFHTDSLDQVKIVMAIEDEFVITIPDADWDDIFQFKDIVAYVEKHVK